MPWKNFFRSWKCPNFLFRSSFFFCSVKLQFIDTAILIMFLESAFVDKRVAHSRSFARMCENHGWFPQTGNASCQKTNFSFRNHEKVCFVLDFKLDDWNEHLVWVGPRISGTRPTHARRSKRHWVAEICKTNPFQLSTKSRASTSWPSSIVSRKSLKLYISPLHLAQVPAYQQRPFILKL